MSTRDFLSNQIKVKKIIGSESQGPKLIVYPDTSSTDSIGGINSEMLGNVGTDTFLFVSGTICGKEKNIPHSVTVFGGDVVISGSLHVEKGNTSLWEIDPDDSNNLVPTNILDGDTGLFALDFNTTLDNGNIETVQYTMTNRSYGNDKYFEFDGDGNVMPRDIENENSICLLNVVNGNA